jgi:CRP-like cAMP-binding protein
MTRRDIAAYVGITPAAVTRSLRHLIGQSAITFRDRQHVQIINRARLEAAISGTRTTR